MKEFANLADGGRQLSEPLSALLADEPAVVSPILPNGVPVALAIAEAAVLPVVPLAAQRTDNGVVIEVRPEHVGVTVVVVDDGVETGTAARAAVEALREAGAARVVLAVPVCPREAMGDLALRYDDVVAVSTPMVRRSLTWHYEDFDTIDESEALRLLADRPS